MSWVNMDAAPINEGSQSHFAYEKEINLAAGGASANIIVPDEILGIAVTVSFSGGGTGYIETTTDLISKIKAGTAVWVAWDLGTVGVTKQDTCVPVSGIRATQVHAGTMKATFRAQ